MLPWIRLKTYSDFDFEFVRVRSNFSSSQFYQNVSTAAFSTFFRRPIFLVSELKISSSSRILRLDFESKIFCFRFSASAEALTRASAKWRV